MIQIYEIGMGINETKIKNNKIKAQTNGTQVGYKAMRPNRTHNMLWLILFFGRYQFNTVVRPQMLMQNKISCDLNLFTGSS